jgi:hypothetical protein
MATTTARNHVAQSPRKVHSDVFEVCEEPEVSPSHYKAAAAAAGTSAGPPIGALTPTRSKARRSALRVLSGKNRSSNIDAAYNDGSFGTEFVPIADEPAPRASADAAYNDGSCGMEFEPLRDDNTRARHADAAMMDGGFGTEFVPLPDEPVSRAPADAAYNDGSCGMEFEPLRG